MRLGYVVSRPANLDFGHIVAWATLASGADDEDPEILEKCAIDGGALCRLVSFFPPDSISASSGIRQRQRVERGKQ